ncbi:hypothetical protein MSAN_00538000 [Mycena sanguinolenta]|uniref:Uncharacterized protein n=1 Tax=Mycena sanguinolenta TaxID=230812 RepID=A0A8H6Z664_9AGAR|nr:hypothetical protein MSAN_00538000 [Mycena sanguinolenta]
MCRLCRLFNFRVRVKTNSSDNAFPASQSKHFADSDSPANDPNTNRTASGSLQAALNTLGSVASTPSVRANLIPVIDNLIATTKRVEETTANTKGLAELAARIELLVPILSQISEKNSNEEKTFIADLQRELQALTKDLQAAYARGQLDQFFNISIEKYNTTLTQMVADLTVVTVHEVLRKVERLKTSELSKSGTQDVLGDVTGGLGDAGSSAHIGSQGGEGEGPQLNMDPAHRLKIGKVSGGIGGAGGAGVDVGGKGGTGKGPVIRLRRSRETMSFGEALTI